ncbi:hypothetical protein P4S72_25335 [Vibrio sp. PP-XX7]
MAWVGVALAHILFNTEHSIETTNKLNYRGLAAWFISTLVGIGMMHATPAVASFSAPTTFIISLLIYISMSTGSGKRESRVTTSLSNAGLPAPAPSG